MEPEINYDLEKKLQEVQKQLSKKQFFEEAVACIRSLLHQYYSSSSPSIQKLFYTVICRVATVLKTRYTALGFWNAGLGLFLEAEKLISGNSEQNHLRKCIAEAKEHLGQLQNESPDLASSQASRNRGFLFEGHLTVDPEPPQPDWMVQTNLMTAAAALFSGESSNMQEGGGSTPDDAANILQQLVDRFDDMIPMILDNNESSAPKVPPASKEVVAKLPVTVVTDDFLRKVGGDAECAICKENLVVDDKMQELPCKHMFHPPCLKPWLDEHNSCPICRHELQTDDHVYESWKEREREAEEERKGAANAVREGEYMYV